MLSRQEFENEARALFPYASFRKYQLEFMWFVYSSLASGKVAFVHAPTGTGKTISSLLPSIIYAKEKGYKILFLSGRHEHQRIVFDTIKAINNKAGANISLINLVSKRYLCNQEEEVRAEDFNEFCSFLRQNQACEYYLRTYIKGQLSPKAKELVEHLKNKEVNVWDAKKDIKHFCPYEIFLNLLPYTDVVVMDYNYLFNEHISKAFLAKSNIDTRKTIVIVDEAHNLPERVRGMYRKRISSYTLHMIKNEVKELFPTYAPTIEKLSNKIKNIASKESNPGEERFLDTQEFIDVISSTTDLEELVEVLEEVKAYRYNKKKSSYSNTLLNFLDMWIQEGEFARIIRHNKEGRWEIEIVDLDVGKRINNVISSLAGSIFMSATLHPLDMYADLTSTPQEKRSILSLPSPFPEQNKKAYVVLGLTTKYNKRNEEMIKRYGKAIEDVIHSTNSNIIIFFPSYELMEQIMKHVKKKNKKVIIENREMSQQDKKDILTQMSKSKDIVLGAVIGANFYEGVDFKGDMASVAVIVGMPFERPDLVNHALIDHYSNKFGKSKGMDYAYIFPSLNKIIQSAGRIIRSEDERGIIFFMDERYRYPKYFNFLKGFYSPTFILPATIKEVMEKNKDFIRS